jgi:hypothetical protein
MQLRSDVRTQFTEELRIIPRWAYGVAVLIFVGMQILFATLVAIQRYPVPPGPESSWFFRGNHTRLLFLADRLRQSRRRAARYEPGAVDGDCCCDYSRSRYHSVSRIAATTAKPLSAM